MLPHPITTFSSDEQTRRGQTVYPFKKTVILFTLAPALPGLFISLYIGSAELLSRSETINVITDPLSILALLIVSSVFGLIFYGLPALILSIIYACLQLHKCFKHIAITSLAGGCTALMWSHVVPLDMEATISFFFGAASSLLTAIYALPKENR